MREDVKKYGVMVLVSGLTSIVVVYGMIWAKQVSAGANAPSFLS